MPDFNINCGHMMFTVFVFISVLISLTAGQNKIGCYQCTNCSDSSSYQNTNTTAKCYACLKLTVTVEYAPYSYVVRRCVPACLETSQYFGGASAVVSCCATQNCNRGSRPISPVERRHLFVGLAIFYSLTKLFVN